MLRRVFSPWPWIIFTITFGVHALSPRTSSGDSRWTVPIALGIIEHGDTSLDRYGELLQRERFYAAE